MASFYGRQQQTTDQGATQPKVTTASSCQKSCERIMNQCLVDAQSFEQKERCRDRYDVCSDKCGAAEEPVVIPKIASPAEPEPTPEPTPAPTGDPIKKCFDKCGGYVEPCFSQCLYEGSGVGEGEPCTITAGCQTGLKCINGICTKSETGKGSQIPVATCAKMTGRECQVDSECGYMGECTGKTGADPETGVWRIGKCACKSTIPAATPAGGGGGGGGGGGEGGGGEFAWSDQLAALYNQLLGKAGDYLNVDLPEYALTPELQALLDQLLGRAGEYMARKPGYSQSALEAQFGKNYEYIRNQGNLTRQQTLSDLQREGMLGTGAGIGALRNIPWQTEQNVSDVIRDVFLGNEEQKRKDLESFTNIASGLFGQGAGIEQMIETINAGRRGEERDYTGIANTLFGTGMTYESLLEQLNAARRGEGQNALALYLQYVLGLMSSWGK